ncbi:hypothetical protein ACFLSY_01795 [Bacteroidota bacterium]
MKNIKILLVSFILTICFVSNDVNAQISELFSYDKTQLAQKMQVSANLEQYVNDNPNVTFSDMTNRNSDILNGINSSPITMYTDSTLLKSYFLPAFALTFTPPFVFYFFTDSGCAQDYAVLTGVLVGIGTGIIYVKSDKKKLSKKQLGERKSGFVWGIVGFAVFYYIIGRGN